jgi:sugar phosphate isomerase/epimerase
MKLSFMWVDKTLPKDRSITGSRLDLKELVRILSAEGYNGIEIMLGDPFKFDFKDMISDAGLEVSQLCTGEFWGSYHLCLNDIDSRKMEKALSWAEKVIRLASQLNCSVNIGRFRGKIWEDGLENSIVRMMDSFRYLDKIAQKLGVRLLIEPLRKDLCDNINSVSEAFEFISNTESESINIMIDTDHTSLEEIQYIKSYFSRIEYIHLADTMHVPLGEGNIPFSEYFKLFKLMRYDGYMSVEVFSQGQDENIVQKSMIYLKRFIRKEGDQWRYQ